MTDAETYVFVYLLVAPFVLLVVCVGGAYWGLRLIDREQPDPD